MSPLYRLYKDNTLTCVFKLNPLCNTHGSSVNILCKLPCLFFFFLKNSFCNKNQCELSALDYKTFLGSFLFIRYTHTHSALSKKICTANSKIGKTRGMWLSPGTLVSSTLSMCVSESMHSCVHMCV